MKRLPLNEPTIVMYYEYEKTGYRCKGENISWLYVDGICPIDCGYTEEHYMFDGQIFYQPKETFKE